MGVDDANQAGSVRGTRWLSLGFESLLKRAGGHSVDMVIVGSGYAGAIAADELTRAGRQVLVLERGLEYLEGMFPSRMSELPGHLRFATPQASQPRGRRTGLFDARLGRHACVLLANGLGGGSLINAGVMLQPEDAVFRDPRWPQALRKEASNLASWKKQFEDTRDLLGGQPWNKPLSKTTAFQGLFKNPVDAIPITVAAKGGSAPPKGASLKSCLQCGDCATGCNHGAKVSLDLNLLARARTHGAEIYCGATVLGFAQGSAGWELSVVHTDERLRQRQGEALMLRANTVILAAGSLGSTELLMRARDAGLPLSDRLGEGFSGNGDQIAVVVDIKGAAPKAVADEAVAPLDAQGQLLRQVGPTITRSKTLDVKIGGNTERFLVQDLAVPGPLRRAYEELVTTARVLKQLVDMKAMATPVGEKDPAAVDPEDIARTLPVALIGHDASNGHLVLPPDARPGKPLMSDGVLGVHWPELAGDPRAAAVTAALRQQLGPGRVLLENPVWAPMGSAQPAGDRNRVADEIRDALKAGAALLAHPLGGCAMGEDSSCGVVNHQGQVYAVTSDRKPSTEVHAGLWVIDGAIVPRSLGANPALTIAVLAQRCVQAMNVLLPVKAPPAPAPAPMTLPPRPLFRDLRQRAQPAADTEVAVCEELRGSYALEGRPRHALLRLVFQPFALRQLMAPTPATLQLDPAACTLDLLDEPPPPLGEDLIRLGAPAWTIIRGRLHCFSWIGQGCRTLVYEIDLQSTALPGRTACIRAEKTIQSFAEFERDPWWLWIPWSPFVKHLKAHWATSPLDALMEVTVKEFPEPALVAAPAPQLRVHLPHFARLQWPLLRITQQQDQVHALADVAGLGLYLLRMLLLARTLWGFIPPKAASGPEPVRLPVALPGLQLETFDLEVAAAADEAPSAPVLPETVKIRLSHYQDKAGTRRPGLPPVLMIHGYSAGGTTFAHPALKPSLAQYLGTRGRDVWVLDLRSSIGFKEQAGLPWSMEQVGCEDIPRAVEEVLKKTADWNRAKQVDVVTHCMGGAMLFMALLYDLTGVHRPNPSWQPAAPEKAARLHESVRRIALSQVGPALMMSPANQARAHLFRYLKHYLKTVPFDFRVDAQAENDALANLIDMALTLVPYPPAERQAHADLAGGRWGEAWVRTRRRMDMLYGRTFAAANLDAGVREHIDEIYGPMNVDTLSQVIHFSRHRSITDRTGLGAFIDLRRLQKRLGPIPVLHVHGRHNGLVDQATEEAMRQLWAEANLNGSPNHPDMLRTHVFSTVEHQDCMIGGARSEPVFRAMGDFLEKT